MSTSQRTFDQVKNILGKLDRNIDDARARRMQDRLPNQPAMASLPTATPSAPPMPIPMPTSNAGPGALAPLPQPVPTTNGTSPRSPFGRATPMRVNRPTPLNNTGS